MQKLHKDGCYFCYQGGQIYVRTERMLTCCANMLSCHPHQYLSCGFNTFDESKGKTWTCTPQNKESISSTSYVQDIVQRQMINKYFETVFSLIFWMGLH